MSPQALTDGLARLLGLPDLPLDEHDRAALRFDDGDFVQIGFCSRQHRVQLYCDVAGLDGRESVYTPALLLALNTPRIEAGLPHFAYDGAGRAVVLCASVALADASPPGLHETMQDLREQARQSRAELAPCGIAQR